MIIIYTVFRRQFIEGIALTGIKQSPGLSSAGGFAARVLLFRRRAEPEAGTSAAAGLLRVPRKSPKSIEKTGAAPLRRA